MYKETINAKDITPFDKEMVEKFNKVEFKVDSKRKINFIKDDIVEVKDFFN